MKNELIVVLGVVGVLCVGSFTAGVRVQRMMAAEPTPTCPAAPPSAPDLSDDLKKCLDTRVTEQLNYVKWRGKHDQQLEACTAALGEATHALAHRSHP